VTSKTRAYSRMPPQRAWIWSDPLAFITATLWH
jgi:hypothetical protein